MHGLALIYSLSIGLLAGWIARLILSRRHGLIVNLLVGLSGGAVGGLIAGALGLTPMGLWVSLVAATAGAGASLGLLRLLGRPPP